MKKEQDILFTLIKKECRRQKNGINLIASENYVSPKILSIVGSCLMNKYVEGSIGARYYSGCSLFDIIEQETIDRFKKVFNAQHVNVQPNSGTQANQAVYFSCLRPGDTILSMDLSHGGHLSHGHCVTLTGSLYKIISYGVDKKTETIDYDQIKDLAEKYQPKLIIAGASSYSRIIDFKKISLIAKKTNALLLVDMAHVAGLVAANLYPNPIDFADFVTMTTQKTFRGPRGGVIFCKQEFAKKVDKAVMPGVQGGAFMNNIAAKGASCQLAMHTNYKDYQRKVIKNAQAMAQQFIKLGYHIISGGTDTHLFLIDLSHLAITGKQAEQLLEKENIFVNRNLIPFDTKSAQHCSGIRIGTAAMTTRGLTRTDFIAIANYIDLLLQSKNNPKVLKKIKAIKDKISKSYF
ncbi:serine hydroxymethyltransferase [Candidatus Dependentiae bacterium]|nr:serine hydroxymethyltransferase [Candidatus Dependentiae bacterium]